MQFPRTILLFGAMVASAVPASLLHPTWTWGQKIVPTKRFASSDREGTSTRVPIKTEEKPFLPFFDLGAPAGPIRPDGTFKGRVPGDTLVPSSKGAYTTLDKLQKGNSKGQKRPQKKIRGGLGGLDPKEVFYADEDLIIIKGGGFGGNSGVSYYEPSQEIEFRDALDIPLGKPVQIPSPGEEYNGNIPIFLPPPSLAASRFSPLSLFLPSSIVRKGQASSLRHAYAAAPSTQPGNRFFLAFIPNRAWRFPYQYHPSPPVLLPLPFFHFPPLNPASNTNALEKEDAHVQLNHKHKDFPHGGNEVPQSLQGDTDVNYLHPLPALNPDAEVFLPRSLDGERETELDSGHYEEFPSHEHKKHTPKQRGKPKL